MITWHVLTPEYPPACGGVGDYTALVSNALAAAGDRVHVWCPAGPAPLAEGGPAVVVHRLPDRFGRASRAEIDAALAAERGVVLVQYVPGAFGLRGLNVPFCLWLASLRRRGAEVRVMFHEPFFYFGLDRPWRNIFAIVQRGMAAILLRAATRVYYPTETWRRLLRRFGPQTHGEVLPIPATIPVDAAPEPPAAGRRSAGLVVGHFGTYGEHVSEALGTVLPALLRRLPDARAVLIGRGGDAFVRTLPSDIRERVETTGRLSGDQVAAALRACDLLVQPYPDGVTTRRTSMMAALSSAVPVVTTQGALTEPIWTDGAGVALAPAGDVRAFVERASGLAADAAARTALGRKGRELYDRSFALPVTVSRMRR